MKIATWNVNSLKVRLPHLLDWQTQSPVDVICLQETKTEDKNFPLADIEAAGFHCAYSGQKTYNGVAILSREPINDVQIGIPDFADEQKRVIAATINGVRIICVYIPNGQEVGSDKYAYKLRWLAALHDWLKDEMQKYPKLALLGDYNIVPDDRDVYDPVAWKDKVLCSAPERDAFKGLLALGLRDSFRLFEDGEKLFSWWDYRMMAFRRNMGMRIDHILISDALQCSGCHIDKAPRKLERPSDHTPVVADVA
ncbi:MAG: exodeoxyribonuclease III [Pseudomonadota bacterium]